VDPAQLLPLIKDPAVVMVLGWAILELRSVRRHLRLLHDEREEHAERLARVETRLRIPPIPSGRRVP
jgi:hypothetical protein